MSIQERTQPTTLTFPENPVVRHTGNTVPNSNELRKIAEGRAYWITESCLEKIRHIAQRVQAEVLLALVEQQKQPGLICDVLVGKQKVSSGFCEFADDLEICRLARRAEKQGLRLAALTHSHHLMTAFTSNTDFQQMAELAEQGCGLTSSTPEVFQGTISAKQDEALVEFPNVPAIRVRMRGPTSPASVAVEVSRERTTSSFSTTNQRGETIVPTCVACRCPTCGGTSLQEKAPSQVTVHVVEDGHPSQEELACLDGEIVDKVQMRVFHQSWRFGYEASEYDVSPRRRLLLPGSTSAYAPQPARLTYDVFYEGNFVGSVSAAAMEEAATQCEPLRQALGF